MTRLAAITALALLSACTSAPTQSFERFGLQSSLAGKQPCIGCGMAWMLKVIDSTGSTGSTGSTN